MNGKQTGRSPRRGIDRQHVSGSTTSRRRRYTDGETTQPVRRGHVLDTLDPALRARLLVIVAQPLRRERWAG